jgi:hypothetical protein
VSLFIRFKADTKNIFESHEKQKDFLTLAEYRYIVSVKRCILWQAIITRKDYSSSYRRPYPFGGKLEAA